MFDLGFFQWLAGGIAFLATAAVGHLNKRINRLEDKMSDELHELRNELDSFKEKVLTTVATKEDIRDMELRILSLLRTGFHDK